MRRIAKVKRSCNWCGAEFYVYQSQIKRGGGKFCSNSCKASFRNTTDNPAWRPEVRRKISLNHADVSGKNNPMYGKSGVLSPSYIDGRSSISGDIWRKIAFLNKPRRCEICGKEDESRRIHVHHKDKNRDNNDLENLQVVCVECHNTLHPKSRDSLGRFIKEVI
jgi:5-methylcytosine-specific restriction endonuclease McrA